MLLWDIDRSLSQLVDLYGFDRAVRAYTASHTAVRGLTALIFRRGIACNLRRRKALYLTVGDRVDDLLVETALRSRAGLPTAFLPDLALRERFNISRAGAIVSPDAPDAEPAALVAGLLEVALARGARLCKGDAVNFDSHSSKVTVGLDDGFEVEARHVVLATGYVMPAFVHATVQQVSSSWAIATTPQPNNLWPEGVLIWEASENYHYARTTAEGRIFGGGTIGRLSNPKNETP
jgi:glycine/D-amino acid oxidase-like deaminating enzyme